MAYRYTPTAQQNFTTRLYDLTLTPTIGKSVTSITMSTGGTVHVFAITGETA
jgi:hypothetical protein